MVADQRSRYHHNHRTETASWQQILAATSATDLQPQNSKTFLKQLLEESKLYQI